MVSGKKSKKKSKKKKNKISNRTSSRTTNEKKKSSINDMILQNKIEDLLSLAKIDTLESEKKRIDYLLYDPSPEVRATAVGTLISMYDHGKYVIPALINSLTKDSSNIVREAVMSFILSNWISNSIINQLQQFLPILIDLMEFNSNRVIRLKACNTLINLIPKFTETGEFIDKLLSRLSTMLNKENKIEKDLKIMAVEILGYCNFPQSQKILIHFYNNESDSLLKGQAIRSIGRLNGKESLKFLENEFITTADNLVKGKILETYGILKADAKISQILKILKEDPEPLMREYAAKSLGEFKIKSQEILDALRFSAEHDASEDVKYAAYLSYEKINCPGCVATFSMC
jgi:HEAT repeat protein